MAKNNEVTLEKALSMAKQQHQTGNLTLADKTYRDIIKIYPNNFTSLHFLGIIAYQRGVPKEGVSFMRQAINVNADNHETWNAYAVMLELTGEVGQAFEAWESALKIKPDYQEALSNYANALWKMKDYKKAQEICEHALEIQDDFFPALINMGAALVAQDKKEEAIEYWEKSLKVAPDNFNAHVNIGNALRDLGRLKESEEHSLKALELSPDNPEALLNLASVLIDQMQYNEAEKYLKKATNARPDFVQAHANLSVALMHQLRFEEALTSAKYAVAFDSEFGEAYGHMAVTLRELGRLSEAEDAARKALHLEPDSAEARIDLGEILFLADNFDEAATLFNEAMELAPDNSRLYLKLSNALERANRSDEAIEALEKAVEKNPEMPEAYHLKGLSHLNANEPEKSMEALNKALEIKPDFAEAMATKSELMQAQGDLEGAKKLINQAIEINDQFPSVYLTYGKTNKFKKDDPILRKMEEHAENIGTFGRAQAPILYYALFKAYEDIGEYDKAFEALKKGADIRRSCSVYNEVSHSNFLEKIINSNTIESIETFDKKGSTSDVPIFIVGMPRSGTTLTEQIISSHPDIYGAGELYTLHNVEREMDEPTPHNAKEWGDRYVELVRNINDESKAARKITDKMPSNFTRLGQIVTTMPNAKIIHCRRNPIDTCLSCYKQLFSRGHYWSYNLEEIVGHYKQYDTVMAHWRKIMPERFLEINYEDTINDFENQARKLLDYVEMEWDDACLTPHKSKRSVLTASKAQVRKPIYNTSIESWKRYEEQLQPLVEGLKDYV